MARWWRVVLIRWLADGYGTTPCCSDDVAYCPTGFGSLAQAPDGRPLQCNTLGSAAMGTWAVLPQGNLG